MGEAGKNARLFRRENTPTRAPLSPPSASLPRRATTTLHRLGHDSEAPGASEGTEEECERTRAGLEHRHCYLLFPLSFLWLTYKAIK